MTEGTELSIYDPASGTHAADQRHALRGIGTEA